MAMKLKFYVKEKLSQRRAKTPEGFLICYDVPINRTGEQKYGPNETPVDVCPVSGFATINREDKEVFKKETLESFNAKPVIIYHVEEVNPSNWKELSVGIVTNVHRGEGMDEDATLADLWICDVEAIGKIERNEMLEVSCGYECDYEDLGGGRGRQLNIIGNHVALVDRARCGSRCSIGDEEVEVQTEDGGTNMLKGLADRISQAFEKKDKKALDEALAEIKDESKTEMHVHVHASDAKGEEPESEPEDDKDKAKDKAFDAMDARIGKLEKNYDAMASDIKSIKDAVTGDDDKDEDDDDEEDEDKKKAKDAEETRKLEGNLEEEAPAGTGDKARKAKDSAFLEESFQETLALAEIIVPGIKAPTFDGKATPRKTFDNMCAFRKKVLELAQANAESAPIVEEVLGKKTLDSMDCASTRTAFRAVGAVMKRNNNDAISRGDTSAATFDGGIIAGPVKTLADLNKANSEYKW